MMSVVAPLVPFAAIVGYGLGYVIANQINRHDLRRLRMLARYAAMLENEIAVHRRPPVALLPPPTKPTPPPHHGWHDYWLRLVRGPSS